MLVAHLSLSSNVNREKKVLLRQMQGQLLGRLFMLLNFRSSILALLSAKID